MAIKQIRLKDFRNIKEVDLKLSSGTTILYGGIGEGKTNLLEAIYLLSIGRSYRTQTSRNLISWGKEETAVKGEGDNSDGNISMLVKINNTGKKIEVNGTSHARSVELLGKFRSVLFHSEDMRIVKDDPSYRRKFLDMVISQISKNYAYSLRDYLKALRQRNQALLNPSRQNTDIWDEQLATLGSWITEVRLKTIKQIEEIASRIYKTLRGQTAELTLKYVETSSTAKDEYLNKLKQVKPYDLSKGTTSIGPHRDDISIRVNTRNAKHFASSGEQKVIVLSLKMAEAEFIKGMTNETPLILLDDVFSQIDEQRARSLIRSTGLGMQCVVTTTDLNSLSHEMMGDAQIYEVKDGKLKSH